MIKTIIKILIIALISLNISNAFADYNRNMNDDIILYNIEVKIGKYIINSTNPEFTANRLKKKIEKILGKNEDEIGEIQSPYKNFKEYGLKSIYYKIRKNREGNYLFLNNGYSNPHILENDYIKILVWDYKYKGETKEYKHNISLDNKSLTTTYSDGDKRNHLEFFKLKPEEKTKDFLINNFLNKNGKIGCELIKYESFNKGKAYYFGLKKKYQSKEVYPGSAICPSEFTKGYSNNGINYFQRISPSTLIYINAGQDYAGIDFSSMEVK